MYHIKKKREKKEKNISGSSYIWLQRHCRRTQAHMYTYVNKHSHKSTYTYVYGQRISVFIVEKKIRLSFTLTVISYSNTHIKKDKSGGKNKGRKRKKQIKSATHTTIFFFFFFWGVQEQNVTSSRLVFQEPTAKNILEVFYWQRKINKRRDRSLDTSNESVQAGGGSLARFTLAKVIYSPNILWLGESKTRWNIYEMYKMYKRRLSSLLGATF